MRAAGLLAHANFASPIDRTGVAGLICETYPDPAIRRLGLWPGDAGPGESHKRDAWPIRDRIMHQLTIVAPWLEVADEHRRACVDADDCLDALVCALVARAVEVGLTDAPPPELVHEASLFEGSIHLPHPDAMTGLI